MSIRRGLRCGSYCVSATVFAVVLSLAGSTAVAQQVTGSAWTFEEALKQLALYPRDPYLQYVTLQLGRESGRFHEASQVVERSLRRQRRQIRRNDQNVNAFGIFSGALAIQESLQLDRLTPDTDPDVLGSTRREDATDITTLRGPTIKSHPWKQMLLGRKPAVSRLSKCVPSDYLFVEAQSVIDLLELKEVADLWGKHAFAQTSNTAHTQLFAERLLDQLALDTSGPLRELYDVAVGRVALTSSDVFFREGTDVTIIFEVKQPVLLQARMQAFNAAAQIKHPDAKIAHGKVLGVEYTSLTSPDRAVHVYSAEPGDNLFVRSNSLVALERVLGAIRGQDAQGAPVERLGDTDEFAYIRTLMPLNADEEEVLVYLSDPFIRRLVGPQLKLTELRRMHCYNHLRMMGHGSLLHQTQFGEPPVSLEALVKSSSAPDDFLTKLRCPDGGKYQLNGLHATCSHHGHANSLTPCCEIPLQHATPAEVEAYKQFLNRYNQYWRRFFDPIAIRIKLAPEAYRIETIILPLIDNTLYTGLAAAFNGEPEVLENGYVPDRTIFSAAVRLNKAELAEQMGAEELLVDPDEPEELSDREQARKVGGNLRQIGLAMHNFHDAFDRFPPRRRSMATNTQLSWRVHLLPFLGESELYREFRIDEPWDSPHNKRLIPRIPAVFRPQKLDLAKAGKTQIMLPTGKGLLYQNSSSETQIAKITDGTALTILLVEANSDQADFWTKPADVAIDLKNPSRNLQRQAPGGYVVLFGDGRVSFLRDTITAEQLAAGFTSQGEESISVRDADVLALRLPRRANRRRQDQDLLHIGLARFLLNGLGDRVGIHVYDADPLIGFSMAEFVGELVRSMSRSGGVDDDLLFIGLMIASVSSPVYVSADVNDPQTVDDFLDSLDELLARKAREPEETGFIRFKQDFYRYSMPDKHRVRSYAIELGPIKARMFWARIGNSIYVTSKPYILEDLLRGQNAVAAAPAADEESRGHAMIRLRPENWNRILGAFELGWSEAHRTACLENLGPLSSLHRAIPAGQADRTQMLAQLAARIYDAHFFCPDAGKYTPEGQQVVCSVHGTALRPDQLTRPADDSGLAQFLKQFEQLTMTLTFLEDGLHAVVTIDRK